MESSGGFGKTVEVNAVDGFVLRMGGDEVGVVATAGQGDAHFLENADVEGGVDGGEVGDFLHAVAS